MLDLSPSLDFGTAACEKRDLAVAALAAVSHLTAGVACSWSDRRGLLTGLTKTMLKIALKRLDAPNPMAG